MGGECINCEIHVKVFALILSTRMIMSEVAAGTRDRILDVCLRLFNESGTLRRSRAWPHHKGSVYDCFKKKEDILFALFEMLEDPLNGVGQRTAGRCGHDRWRRGLFAVTGIKRTAPKLAQEKKCDARSNER